PLLCKEGAGEVETPYRNCWPNFPIASKMPKDPRLYLTLVLPLQRGGMTGSLFGRKYVTE
ncbi:MAG TPA: hypothetical protein VLA60_01575, partial [Nitrospirales bacterium]|nr:hypothetical protein [Nitrospirales bacterium]